MLMIASLLSGLVFGAGLLISGMVMPTKVLAFLDIFGAWDPSLAVVMISALAVSAPGFMLASGRSRPLLAAQSVWPAKNQIDRPLIVGAVLFGVGWGLVGLCPGPNLLRIIPDRKSTRLNSSHLGISYAVFCLKKKKNKKKKTLLVLS